MTAEQLNENLKRLAGARVTLGLPVEPAPSRLAIIADWFDAGLDRLDSAMDDLREAWPLYVVLGFTLLMAWLTVVMVTELASH